MAPERAPAAVAPPAPADAAPTAKDMADLRAENARLAKTNGELADSERFWSERARAGEKPEPKEAPAPAATPADEDDYDDPAKFVEALSTKGAKAVAGYLKKAGYITKAEAEELATKSAKAVVDVARASLTADAELIGRYPELKDDTSALFKATAKHVKEMIADDPKLKNSPMVLKTAAKLAKLELAAADKENKPEETAEEKRQARIDAQSGSRGRRAAASFDDDDDDTHIGSQAREIMDAMHVTDADYLAERSKLRGKK